MKRHSFARRAYLATLIMSTLMVPVAMPQPASAQTPAAPANANIDAIKPLVQANTIAVVQLDMKRLDLPVSVKASLASNATGKQLSDWLMALTEKFAPLLSDRLTVMIDVPASAAQAPLRIIAKKPATLDVDKLNASLAEYRLGAAVIEGDYVTVAASRIQSAANPATANPATGNPATGKPATGKPATGKPATGKPVAGGRPPFPANDALLAEAAEPIKSMPVQLLIVPPSYLVRTYEDLMPNLPSALGGAPLSTFTEGVKWAAVGLDPSKMQVQATIQSKSASAAQRLADELPKLVKIAAAALPEGEYRNMLSGLTTLGPAKVVGDRIELAPTELGDANMAGKIVVKVLSSIVDPLSQRENMNRLKQLALAIHNYESANRCLPPNKAARKADGSSNLSWRVHILPYIDQMELYKQFKLDEAWDSPHNIKLLEKMPEAYASTSLQFMPGNGRVGYTTFVAPVGDGTIFGGKEPVTLSKVTDGTSNTIFFIEVKPSRSEPWAAPQDYAFDPRNPGQDLAIGNDEMFLTAFADGSVRLLPAKIGKEDLLHLFQMNDGNVVTY